MIVTSENTRTAKMLVPRTNAGAVSLGFGKLTAALSGSASVDDGDEAGGAYGGGAFSDSPLSGTVLSVVAAAGASFFFGEGLAVSRRKIVSGMIATTATQRIMTTTSLWNEERKPARRHLADVRLALLCTVTFPMADFV